MADLITVTSLRELDNLVAVKVLGIKVSCADGEYYKDESAKKLIPKY